MAVYFCGSGAFLLEPVNRHRHRSLRRFGQASRQETKVQTVPKAPPGDGGLQHVHSADSLVLPSASLPHPATVFHRQ
jgi:hypothetical protein